MSWHTVFLREETRRHLALEVQQPYLTSLLRSRPRDAELAARRLRNLIRVRASEAEQSELVDGLPYHVVFDPSSVCNLACPLCVQATNPTGRRRTFARRHDFFRSLAELETSTIRLDLFNWGEPLLHPELPDMISAADARSIYTRTSSHMSHRHGIPADALVESGLCYLVASIDGATQATYERYRVGGDLQTVLRNVDALCEARAKQGRDKPVIEWQYLVFEHNANELQVAMRLAASLGVDVFRYGGARARMAAKLLQPSETAVSGSVGLLPASHELSEYDAAGERTRLDERERCRWLWGKAALNADGGLAPCWSSWFAEHDLGSWVASGVGAVWNSEGYQAARRAARGRGNPCGPLVCDVCAFHRNFVPTPDSDTEVLPDRARLLELAAAMEAAGCSPDPQVVVALAAEVERGVSSRDPEAA